MRDIDNSMYVSWSVWRPEYNGPDETKDEPRIAINNIFCSNILQIHLYTNEIQRDSLTLLMWQFYHFIYQEHSTFIHTTK